MRCAVTPGNRAMESAMLVSGSLPMSSALTTSTMEVDSLLVAIDVSIDQRMPVTTTSSSAVVAARILRARYAACASKDRGNCGGHGIHGYATAVRCATAEPMSCTDFHRYPPASDRLAISRGRGTCSESGSLLLKRYKVIRSPRMAGNGNLPTLPCGIYWGRMGVSITRRPSMRSRTRLRGASM